MSLIIENVPVDAAPVVGEIAVTTRLLAGMMVSTDLNQARRFYEDFLGLDCVRCAPERMLVRDHRTKAAMEAGSQDVFILDVRHADAIANPQRQLHHWGLTVDSSAEVDRVYAIAKAQKETLGLRKLLPVADNHGAHSFYMADRDMNWWEIERRIDGLGNEAFFASGDIIDGEHRDTPRAADAPLRPGASGEPVVHDVELTHGTCEQLSLETSRSFVEQVLGLRCVRHLVPAQVIAGAGSFAIFAIRLARVRPQQFYNRWIVGVNDVAEIKAVAQRAEASSEALGIASIGLGNDGQSCAIQDGDGNWWEVVANDTADYHSIFERGDMPGVT